MSSRGNRAACRICEGTLMDHGFCRGLFSVLFFVISHPKTLCQKTELQFTEEVKAIDREEACELLLVNRNYLYQLMYKAFAREPDPAFLSILTAPHTGECFSLLGGEVLEAVPAYLARLGAEREKEKALEDIKEEYTRLFVGPIEPEAPPWESVYVGEGGLLFQESTLKVRECYRRFGLLPEEYRRVADDSLALELAFMAELSLRSVDAFEGKEVGTLSQTLEAARDFLTEHLLVWIPQLSRKAAKAKTDRLYPRLLRILDSFLKKDLETLNDLLVMAKKGENAHD